MNANGWQHDQLLSGLKQKVDEIEVLQQRLAQNKEQLLLVIKGIEGKPAGMACADNAQRLIQRLCEEGVASAPDKQPAAAARKPTPVRHPEPDGRYRFQRLPTSVASGFGA